MLRGGWRRATGNWPVDLQEGVTVLAEQARAVDGVAPLSEAVLLAVPAPVTHLWWASEDKAVHAYGQIGADGVAEFVVAPSARRAGLGDALAARVADSGAKAVWAHGNRPAAQVLAANRGWWPLRVLQQLGRALPTEPEPEPVPGLPPGLRLRPYAGAVDDAALLRVNAAAFQALPDQGSWGPAELAARTSAPWFDPAGLLLLEEGGEVIGFHWTKVHPDGTGEVYVLALDPAAQGRGLAGPLTAAGLDHLAQIGCREVILYVDSANTPAVALYTRAGFSVIEEDVQYRVSGAAAPA